MCDTRLVRIDRRAFGLVLLALAMLASPVRALTATELTVAASAGPSNTLATLYGANIGVAEEDYSFSDARGTWNGSGRGQAGGERGLGVPPTADAQASVFVSSTDPDAPLAGDAGAGGIFVYEMQVASTRPTPIGFVPPLNLFVEYHGSAQLSGDLVFSNGNVDSGATAQVAITVPFLGRTIVNEVASADHNQLQASFSGSRAFTIAPGELAYPVRVQVSAGVGVFVVGSGRGSGQAVADPVFGFDQEAFDEYAALAGFSTFSLADYFALEYSPGYYAPEPGTGLLLAVGLALGMRRARPRGGPSRG